ncbi:mynd zinc finger domain-like protein [Moniliophthora roreri]|uniref:Uncharacterized protein n=1 Tax=Moniliophthora roreri TaxID=221103 RepID=A0A0W0F3B2_MONRR|nr:mynd zinc finger domain-like protein [Moniliophthora roreri]
MSSPDARLRSILDSIVIAANRDVIPLEQVWRQADAWISFLVRAFIRQGLATTPEGIDFQDRLITVSSFFLCSCLRDFPSRSANHLYPFFILMFELAVYIADIDHPCFGILWEEIYVALNVSRSLGHRLLINSVASVASKYDVGALCIRRLAAAVNAWADIDVATVYSAISFLVFCGYHVSDIHQRLLSLHGIRWVALVMSHTASKLHPFSPGCKRLNELLSHCTSFLEANIAGNPAAIREALDGHLLIALAKLNKIKEFCAYDLRIDFANLVQHIEFGIFVRSVLNRVLREWKVVQRRGLLQSSLTSAEEGESGCVLYDALQALNVKARKMKESMRIFDAMKIPRDDRCSNNTVTTIASRSQMYYALTTLPNSALEELELNLRRRQSN